jgi:NTP pyrophosphatase (non-canonical NTP hydrolase)
MDERIKKIADYYGFTSQANMLCEESAEYMVALNKLRRGKTEAYANVKEEIADIIVVAKQLRYLLGADEIDRIISEKLDRQIQRIKDESGPETAELPEVDTEGMHSGEIRTERNGDAWKSVMKMGE